MNKLTVFFIAVSAFLLGILVGQILGKGAEIGNSNTIINNY